MNKFLETCNLPRLNLNEVIENLNRKITSKELESIFKNLQTNKCLRSDGFIMTSIKYLKKN